GKVAEALVELADKPVRIRAEDRAAVPLRLPLARSDGTFGSSLQLFVEGMHARGHPSGQLDCLRPAVSHAQQAHLLLETPHHYDNLRAKGVEPSRNRVLAQVAELQRDDFACMPAQSLHRFHQPTRNVRGKSSTDAVQDANAAQMGRVRR